MKTNVETAQSKQNVFYFKFNVTVRGEPVGTGPTPDIRTVDTCRLVRYETSVEIVFRKKKKTSSGNNRPVHKTHASVCTRAANV